MILSSCFTFGYLYSHAQHPEPPGCGTSDLHQQRYEQDATYRRAHDLMNQRLYEQSRQGQRDGEPSAQRNGLVCQPVLTIPVVVHIMHLPTDAAPDDNTSNLTDARIQAGIDHINDAFRNRGHYAGGPYHTNAGISSQDVEIEFVLARRTPEGAPTNGIVRVPTSLSNLYRYDPCDGSIQDNCLKALSNWDPTQYLNVWLVNSICESSNGGGCWVDGYAFYASSHGRPYDGVVNEARYWGSTTDNSKLPVHEFGHYLNLLHTFEGEDCLNNDCLMDGDRVCDTPPDADGTTYTSCASPNPDFRTSNSCSTDADGGSPLPGDVDDMYENYMDYGYLNCQNTFTPGQEQRMRMTLQGIRASLLASEGAIPVNAALDAGITGLQPPTTVVCTNGVVPRITVKNYGQSPLTALEVETRLNGTLQGTYTWTGNLPSGNSQQLTLDPLSPPFEGKHNLQVSLAGANGTDKDSYAANDEACLEFAYRPSTFVNALPFCLDFEGTPSLPAGWTTQNSFVDTRWKVYDGALNCGALSSQALFLDTWGDESIEFGATDRLISTVIDLSDYTSATLNYDRAYKRSASSKRFRIQVSQDCGQTFTSLVEKRDAELATTSGFEYSSRWLPQGCDAWQTETLNLTPYVGGQVLIRFEVDYSSSASSGQALFLDNICVEGFSEGVVSCTPPTQVPEMPGVYVADQVCQDEAGWRHFWKTAAASPATASDVLLLSVQNDPALQLSPGQVSVVVTGEYGDGGHDLSSAPYVTNSSGWFVMGRYFDVSPSAQPADPVGVRFYYTNTDFQDVRTAVASSPAAGSLDAHPQLTFYKINQQDPDPTVNLHANILAENFRQYTYAASASLSTWQYAAYGDHHRSEFLLESFSGGGGGSDGLASGGLVFPVELINFVGAQEGQAIALRWRTASELNNDFFEVERADELAREFVSIGRMDGQGTSAHGHAYELYDRSPRSGHNVYRLKQVDIDGSISYSHQVEVYFTPKGRVRVYPNPSEGLVSFQFENPRSTRLSLRILSPDGVEVWRTRTSLPPMGRLSVPMEQFAVGLYFYECWQDGQLHRGKLLKN